MGRKISEKYRGLRKGFGCGDRIRVLVGVVPVYKEGEYLLEKGQVWVVLEGG